MVTKIVTNPFEGLSRLQIRVSWYKVAILVELGGLFVLAVALTVAPQVTLGAVAAAVAWARDVSLTYRPLVALIGLLCVAATAAGLWGVWVHKGAQVAPMDLERRKGSAPSDTRSAAA